MLLGALVACHQRGGDTGGGTTATLAKYVAGVENGVASDTRGDAGGTLVAARVWEQDDGFAAFDTQVWEDGKGILATSRAEILIQGANCLAGDALKLLG